MNALFARTKREYGQDLVEYALVLPILLLLVLGTIDLALVVFSYDTISNAAREGARYAVVHPTDVSGIEARARMLTEGLDESALDISVSYPTSKTVRVSITYDDHLFTGFLMEAAGGHPYLRLRASSTMQIE
jgi:Flp pilus assembly protein TadG